MKISSFLACEKVIKDERGMISLITLLSGIATEHTGSEPMPANAITPAEWWLFTALSLDESDFNETFVQRIKIDWPSGDQFAEMTIAIVFPKEIPPVLSHTTTQQIRGFPIGQSGNVNVTTWIERDRKKVTAPESLAIAVTHTAPKQAPSPQ